MSDIRNVYPIHFALWAPYAPPRALPKQVLFHLPPATTNPPTNDQQKPSLLQGLLATAASSTTFRKAVSVVSCTPAETQAFRHICEYDDETGMRRPLPSHFLTLPVVTNPDSVEDLEEDSHNDKSRRGFMRETLRTRYAEREAAKATYLASLLPTTTTTTVNGEASLMEKMDRALASHLGEGPSSTPLTTMGSCPGTVVQGAYGSVDDCSNMLPNATLCCDTVRDAWRLFQQSDKLGADMSHQRLTSSELIWARGPTVLGKAYSGVEADTPVAAAIEAGDAGCVVNNGDSILRLSQMVTIGECSNYRAFVLIAGDGESHYIGACQKPVEAVYDAHVDQTFEDRRSTSNCIERAMSCLFDSQVNGMFNMDDGAAPTKEVDSSELLSPTATLTEKLSLLCARQTFGSADHSTALLVGVDISFESPTLPLYIFGLDALPMSRSETDAFLKPSIYPQEPLWKADRVPFCRLFRTLDKLRAMYRRSEEVTTGDADTEGNDPNAPCNDPFVLYVARGGDDVFGDIKLVTNHQQYTATGDVSQHHQLKVRYVALEIQIRAIKESHGIPTPTEPPTAPETGGQGAEGVGALIALMKQVGEKEQELLALTAPATTTG